MGLTARYFEVDLKLLNGLKKKSVDEVADIVQDLEDDDDVNYCDLDKMWDGLQFLITGRDMGNLEKSDLLSVFVGGYDVLNEEEFTAIIMPDKVKEVVSSIENLDINLYLDKFEPKSFVEAEIYPKIWDREDKEFLKEELLDFFELLKNFYHNVSKRNNGIIVSIF